LNSIFADYSQYCGDWFIPFVGDDVVVAKCISNLKNKAALDTQKGANLGLKCVWRPGSTPGPLGELERSPRPPSRHY